MKNELPQKWVPWAQLRQGGLGRAAFSKQFASGGKTTAKGLGMLRDAWEMRAYVHVEIRKCPEGHQLAECSGIAVARGGEWHQAPLQRCPSSVCWLLPRCRSLGMLTNQQGATGAGWSPSGQGCIWQRADSCVSLAIQKALEASQPGPGYGGLAGWQHRNDGCICELHALILWGLRELC